MAWDKFICTKSRMDACRNARFWIPIVLRNDATLSPSRVRNIAHVLLCLCQMAFVTWGLLTPDPLAVVRDTSLNWVSSVSDMLKHAFVFAVFSMTVLSLCLVTSREIPPFAVLAVLAYSFLIEGLQAFVPGRSCDPRDALANVVGVVLGLTAVRMLSLFHSS